jgi:FlaA1/EpsC-like NDP-sugar epimerase
VPLMEKNPYEAVKINIIGASFGGISSWKWSG